MEFSVDVLGWLLGGGLVTYPFDIPPHDVVAPVGLFQLVKVSG
jgi:hypothetical protein